LAGILAGLEVGAKQNVAVLAAIALGVHCWRGASGARCACGRGF
jgi:hypothetical protein